MAAQTTHSFPLPGALPVPVDDGACNHLPGSTLPSTPLPSTAGTEIDPSTLPGLTIIFCYPRTAAPDETVPDEWNAIPGARGCTPQACSFRDLNDELKALGVARVLGVSTQDSAYQGELKERTHLPYDLLSDEKGSFWGNLGLPTFEWQGTKLIKRLSLVVRDGKVEKVFYPVFPSDRSAAEVAEYLKAGRKG